MTYRFDSMLLLAGFIVAGAQPLVAQQVVINGRVPADLAAIISVSDPQQIHSEITRSRVGAGLVELIAENLGSSDSLSQQISSAEQSLGFSLQPVELFSQTVSAFDLYLIDRQQQTEVAASIAFRNSSAPESIFRTLKAEAEGAVGVARGVTASTVEEFEMGGFAVLALPAFDLFLARQGTTMLYATDRAVLESSINNAGGPFLATPLFQSFFEGIRDQDVQLWYWGSTAKFINAAGANLPQMDSLSTSIPQNTAGKAQFTRSQWRATSFTPTQQLPAANRRYVLSSPPPGDLGIQQVLPGGALFTFSTNHFDGLNLLDQLLQGAAVGGDDSMAQMAEAQINSARQALGFDPRTDLLANLGPDFGFTMSGADPASGLPIGGVLASGVRDRDRMEKILGFIEDAFTPPPPAPGPDGKTPPPQPNPLSSESHQGADVYTVAGSPIAWTLSPQNRLIVAVGADSVKAALDRETGSGASLAADSGFASLRQGHPDAVNDFTTVSVGEVATLVEGFLTGFGGEADPSATEALEVIKSIRSLTSSSIFGTSGTTQTIVVGLD